ncbi:hypothetical protein JGH11_18950 [Dysgonomonas sp. Marseille-P4677]|uniref:hypothetical protein n=1 Tax=Dysgonomonas sp. Marseille-P4677 TaxID=2364790 RepID=UPI0019147B71|nr:hypothetical protein [Dysgonomonas sp. Marseille-P4677]MBK5722952.1 hypothetical protein [Dysgonomonas sp. Marseille-P4677]
MAKKTYFILIILFIYGFVSCLTTKNSLLVNKRYTLVHSDLDSMSLYFKNKEECIFTHTFKSCNMSERFQGIKIECKYKLKDNILQLKNKSQIDSLRNIAYIKIPDDELEKCEYMKLYTIDIDGKEAGLKGIVIDGRPIRNNSEYIGHLNYIENEKLLFKDSLLLYFKMPSRPENSVNKMGLPVRYSDYYILGSFVLNGYTVDSLINRQIIEEAIYNNTIPINNIINKKK